MIISQVLGGLGNQMFQYAAGWATACARDTTFKLDISGFLNYQLHQGFELEKVFDINVNVAAPNDLRNVLGWQSHKLAQRLLSRPSLAFLRKRTLIVEPDFNYSEVLRQVGAAGYLTGYWQSEKYFILYEEEIRRQYKFKCMSSFENKRWAGLISNRHSVGFHVRRGDFLRGSNVNIHGACSLSYLDAAVRYILERVSEPDFFFFSDDMVWVKKNIKIAARCHYIENNQGSESYNDMHLMSLCKHNIIANSSFSWWGAWLNENKNKIVIAPNKWFASGVDTKDLIPMSWVRI